MGILLQTVAERTVADNCRSLSCKPSGPGLD